MSADEPGEPAGRSVTQDAARPPRVLTDGRLLYLSLDLEPGPYQVADVAARGDA